MHSPWTETAVWWGLREGCAGVDGGRQRGRERGTSAIMSTITFLNLKNKVFKNLNLKNTELGRGGGEREEERER